MLGRGNRNFSTAYQCFYDSTTIPLETHYTFVIPGRFENVNLSYLETDYWIVAFDLPDSGAGATGTTGSIGNTG